MSQKLFASLGALLLCAPAMSLVGAAFRLHPLTFMPLLLAAVALAFGIRLFRRGRMVLLAITAPLLLAVGTQYAMHLGMGLKGLFPAALAVAALIMHLLALCRAPGEEYAPVVWYAGVVVDAIALFFLRAEIFAPAAPCTQPLVAAYIVYIIFALNEQTLANGMAGERRPSPLMRLRNRVRAALLAGVFLLLVYLQAVRDGLDALVSAISRFIAWLINLIPVPEEELVKGEGGGADLGGLLGEGGEPAAIWRVLEQVLRVVALLAAAALTVLLFLKLCQVLKKLIRYIANQLRAYAGRVNDAYEDTVESLLDFGEMRRAVRSARERIRKQRAERVPYDQLSPRDKVRRTYLLLRKKSGNVSDSQTARAALHSGDMPISREGADVVADMYDAARYSTLEISEADAEKARIAAQKKR